MTWSAPFDPTTESIWISASVIGPRAMAKTLIFILDSGAEMTILDNEIADSIGLDRSQTIGDVRFDGVSRSYKAYRVIAPEVKAFGRPMAGLEIAVSPLRRKFHADGLLGLDFFRQLRVLTDFIDGRIGMTDHQSQFVEVPAHLVDEVQALIKARTDS